MTINRATAETREIERVFRAVFPKTDSYRHNSASIRVRIIDPRFQGKNQIERERMVTPLINKLDKDTQKDLIFLLLLTPDEEKRGSLLNLEFINPSPSRL